MAAKLIKPLQGAEPIIENSYFCNIATLSDEFSDWINCIFFCSSHVPFHHYCHAFNSLWCVTTGVYFLTLSFMYLSVCFIWRVVEPRSHWPSWLLSFAWWSPHLGPRCLHPHAPTSRCTGCGSDPRGREGQLGRQLCPQEPEGIRSTTLHCPVEDQLFCKYEIQGEVRVDSVEF